MSDFYVRHWRLVSLCLVVALAGLCAWSNSRVGVGWGTIFFGALAGALLLTVIFKTVMTRLGKY
jgi:hypothetical protein